MNEPLKTCRELKVMLKCELFASLQISWGAARSCPNSIRQTGGVTMVQALDVNVGTLTLMTNEK